MGEIPTFCLIAGEPSGDRLGAALMQGLKAELGETVRFIGVGGPQMQAEGLDSLFPMEELSIMGIVEVLPKLFGLLRRVQETADFVLAENPDVMITIDSPDFCLRVAKKVKASQPNFPTVHYVAPSVWAWRPKRAAKMARSIDHVLALLPFEPPYMEAAGMSCDFVGHPVVAEQQATPDEIAQFRVDIGVTAEPQILTLLPGSRAGEVARLGPIFRDVVERLRQDLPDLAVVIPSVGTRVADLQRLFEGLDVHILDPRGMTVEKSEARKRACYGASAAALAASGTVSLELTAAGTPMVIGYRMNWLTGYLTKRALKISTVTLVNLVTDTRAVPEFLLTDCRADLIYPAVKDLLTSELHREAQAASGARAMALLGKGGDAPGMRAARSVLGYLQGK